MSNHYEVHGCVSFVHFSSSVYDYYDDVNLNLSESVVPVTVRLLRTFDNGAGLKPYLGVGVGAAYINVSTSIPGYGGLSSAAETNACFEILGGVKFGGRWNAEAKMLWAGDIGATGLGVNVGASF